MSPASTPIYESTNASPTLLHLILATLIPVKQRIRIGSSMERYAPADSLTRAVLAWGTTVGVGLLLLKIFGNNNSDNRNDGRVEESSSRSREKLSLWNILSEMLGIKTDHGSNIDTATSRSSSSKRNVPTTPKSLFPLSDVLHEVVHQGSCHCGAISFEFNAPQCLALRFPQDDNEDSDDVDASFDLASVVSSVRRQQGAAILYPSAKVDASGFRLISGQDQWKTYHVQVRRQPDETVGVVVTKAYSFCRICAVHLLHASDDDAFSISINVHTLTTPWTSTLEEEARDVYHHQDEEEEEEEEEDFPTGHRRSTFRPTSRSQPRKQQQKKNKPQTRKQHHQPRRQQQPQQQQQQQTSGTRRIVTPQQGDSEDTAMSTYMMANNPLSAGVDWPLVDDDDNDDDNFNADCNHHYTADEEEESTISSTTTTSSSPLLDGTATTATTMSASTMTQSVVAEQQQQQQPTTTTADPVTREKLRQYMAKHMTKKNNKTSLTTTTSTIAETNHFE